MTAPDAMRRHAQSAGATVTAQAERLATDLADLVRIESVSSDVRCYDAVDESAAAIARLVRDLSLFDQVDVVRSVSDGVAGRPAVVASRPSRRGRPTVLLYAHHDVQPVGDLELWDRPPFDPEIEDGRMYGRGAADDKAGVMTHVAALRALAQVLPDPDLGLVMFVEGEEECGSATVAATLIERRDQLRCDVAVVCDSDNWTPETPALTTSLRGAILFDFEVRTLNAPLHSGMFGGAAPDAFMCAAVLVASLYKEDGSVAVKGLRRGPEPDIDFDKASYMADAGLIGAQLVGGGSITGRVWQNPSITVIGVDAPTCAEASTSLMSTVRLRVNVRVTPEQSPDEAFSLIADHLRRHAPFGATISFEDVRTVPGLDTTDSGLGSRTMREALANIWPNPAVSMGIGGSIGFVAAYRQVFPDSEILVIGTGDPASNIHGYNESVEMRTLLRMASAEAAFLLALDSGSAEAT